MILSIESFLINNTWAIVVLGLIGLVALIGGPLLIIHSLEDSHMKFNYETCKIEDVPTNHKIKKRISGIICFIVGVSMITVLAIVSSKRIDIKWQYAIENEYEFWYMGYSKPITSREAEKFRDGHHGIEFDDDKKIVKIHRANRRDEMIDGLWDALTDYGN